MPIKTVFYFPERFRRDLKAAAAREGKSMKAFIMEHMAHAVSSHIPNDETIRAIEEAEKGIGLTEYNDINDLFKELGI